MTLASLPLDQILWLVGILLAAGFATGILAGLFGIGGGAIVVPVLYEVFGAIGVPDALRMHLAVGSALAIIMPTALRSFFAHRSRTKINTEVLRQWVVPLVIGVLAGTAVAAVSPDRVLQFAFVVFAALMSIRLLFARDSWVLADDLPGRWTMRAYGVFIGVIASLVGISGGGIAVAILSLYRVPIHQAIGTSSVLGALIAVPGVIGYVLGGWPHLAELPPLSLGFISIPGALLVGTVAVLAAPLGAILAHRFSKRQLEIGFGVYLALVGARFLAALVAG